MASCALEWSICYRYNLWYRMSIVLWKNKHRVTVITMSSVPSVFLTAPRQTAEQAAWLPSVPCVLEDTLRLHLKPNSVLQYSVAWRAVLYSSTYPRWVIFLWRKVNRAQVTAVIRLWGEQPFCGEFPYSHPRLRSPVSQVWGRWYLKWKISLSCRFQKSLSSVVISSCPG